jgi:hypothetical protein
MTQTTHPTPQELRDYLAGRRQEGKPPPEPAEIRRRLGWGLLLPPQLAVDCPR